MTIASQATHRPSNCSIFCKSQTTDVRCGLPETFLDFLRTNETEPPNQTKKVLRENQETQANQELRIYDTTKPKTKNQPSRHTVCLVVSFGSHQSIHPSTHGPPGQFLSEIFVFDHATGTKLDGWDVDGCGYLCTSSQNLPA